MSRPDMAWPRGDDAEVPRRRCARVAYPSRWTLSQRPVSPPRNSRRRERLRAHTDAMLDHERRELVAVHEDDPLDLRRELPRVLRELARREQDALVALAGERAVAWISAATSVFCQRFAWTHRPLR